MFPLIVGPDDNLGKMYIRLAGSSDHPVAMYFEGVERLQDLLRNQELQEHIKGFYLSMWTEGGIRFSYWTERPEYSEEYMSQQFDTLDFNRYLPNNDQIAQSESYSGYCTKGKQNIEFRRFLQLTTNIGLDSIKSSIPRTRDFAARYRLDIGPARTSSREHFTEWFGDLPYYNSLDATEVNELHDGLDFWYTDWQDWAHMFIVMTMPGDLIYVDELKPLFQFRQPLLKQNRDVLYNTATGKPNVVDNS